MESLSDRERETLRLLGRGHEAKSIASTLGLSVHTVNERLRLLRSHPGPLLAFGLCVWCFLFIPLVNLLLIPAAVAGGTLLFIDLGLGTRKLAKSQHSAKPEDLR